jgi:hypothetical protein
LATQQNLWAQGQEFNERLALFETRIDEQYEDVANNFAVVTQDMAHLREATDNLDRPMSVNMERRMESHERTKLGRRHHHRSSSSSSSSSQTYSSHDRQESSHSNSRH